MTKSLKNRFFWITAAISLILDQLTKHLVVQNFELKETLALWPDVFHFTYVLNPGAAFSFFQGEAWLRWLSLIVSLGLIALAVFGPAMNTFEQLGYGFILGGALGNGIDRFFNHCVIDGKLLTCVVDFLDFRLIRFPVFNLADVFINVGIICLLIASVRPQSPTSNSRRS
jgi:signal peptidase II